jgi:hypothetical protein
MVKRVAAERALDSLPNQYFIFVEQAEVTFSPFECRAMSLVAFEYAGEHAVELIENEAVAGGHDELPEDIVGEEFLRNAPAECLVVQRLKNESAVPVQLWFNKELDEVPICRVYRAMFDQEDWETCLLNAEHYPICHAKQSDGVSGHKFEVLTMLRSFADDSPVPF